MWQIKCKSVPGGDLRPYAQARSNDHSPPMLMPDARQGRGAPSNNSTPANADDVARRVIELLTPVLTSTIQAAISNAVASVPKATPFPIPKSKDSFPAYQHQFQDESEEEYPSEAEVCVDEIPNVETNSREPESLAIPSNIQPPPFCTPDIGVDRALTAMKTMLHDQAVAWASEQQRQAMAAVLAQQTDVVAVLRTGGGKSMLAIIPSILEKDRGATVLILPLNSLMMDFERRLKSMGVPFQIYGANQGSLNPRENLILVTADQARTNGWRESISVLNQRKPVVRFVFDESHLPLIANDYREALQHIYELRSLAVQMVLLTATLPPSSVPDIKSSFGLGKDALVVRQCTNREELTYFLEKVPPTDLISRAVAILELERATWENRDRALVFVPTLALGERVAEEVDCSFYNGNRRSMTDEDRNSVYHSWVRGDSKIMVATSAFSTGNDYPNVRLVIHLDRPWEMLEFIQGQGRAGRDGLPAKCYALVPPTASRPTAPAPDHKGKTAMYEHLYLYGLKRCLRYGITLHNDGIGISCCSLSSNQLCCVCARDPNHNPTDIRIAPAPRLRCGFSAPSLPPSITPIPAASSSFPPAENPGFVEAMKRSNNLRSEREQEVTDRVHSIRRALEFLKHTCSFCKIWGDQIGGDHELSRCPRLSMSQPIVSWGQYIEWRRELVYSANHKKICYACHIPQINDDMHRQFTKAGKGLTCEFADIVAPTALGIFLHHPTQQEAAVHFRQTLLWSSLAKFTNWLVAEPRPGSYSNLFDLVLWFIGTREAQTS
ncbi:P-loop containing nucleoside triphosphate hydrolase protein [Suillus hirtellus]|nr:P-loop containing nucleoside triphosphate hydrolase protein [Suillus hirtellus]